MSQIFTTGKNQFYLSLPVEIKPPSAASCPGPIEKTSPSKRQKNVEKQRSEFAVPYPSQGLGSIGFQKC
jgi:hypothetical protein